MLSHDPNDEWVGYLDPKAYKLLLDLEDMMSGVARILFNHTVLCKDSEPQPMHPDYPTIYASMSTCQKMEMLKKYGTSVKRLSITGINNVAVT